MHAKVHSGELSGVYHQRNGTEKGPGKEDTDGRATSIVRSRLCKEVVLKRKVYVGIKRVLKEKNIRFQTPLDRMRIHWDSGTRTYDIAQDAAQELRRRGFSVEIPDRNASELYPEKERLHQTKTWQRVGERSAGGDEPTSRVRKRLQEYERIPPETN